VRVVFMGTPSFAVPSLRALARRHEIVSVYTRPDAVSGRGRTLHPSAVKQAAAELGLDVRTPDTLRDDEEVRALADLAPDAGVVAAYGLILPARILAVPSLGFVNVHASLLPRWRGAAPVQRAILAGDRLTGVSIMRMEEGLDTGPFCERVEALIDDKNAEVLTAELASLGASALTHALERLEAGTCDWKSQCDADATYAGKISKADVRLEPSLRAVELSRRVRASSRQAPARAVVSDVPLTVTEVEPSQVVVPQGVARRRGDSILLGTVEGTLELVRVKPDGRNEMDVASWLRGSRVSGESLWSGSA
jgi:methionyl-tRNA formyltransferase